MANFLGSVILFLICAVPGLRWLELICIGYGPFRVVEAFVYQINVLVFNPYRRAKRRVFGGFRAPKKPGWRPVLSLRRLVVMSLQNYAEIIFWFALFYRHWGSWFKPIDALAIPLDPFLTWLNLSFATMTTFGYPSVSPARTCGIFLILAQSAIGVFMALLILAGFISLLPPHKTRDRSERT